MLFGIDAASWSAILLAIAWLVLLEGLLSADNALVLAVMVRHLPKKQQKRALRYGIWGAFVFRLIAVIFATILLEFWWLKVVGGFYLLFLAVRHFLGSGGGGDGKRERAGTGFWATVVNVELADIAFSVDSILAAVAMSEKLPPKIEHMELGPFWLVGQVPLKLVIIYLGGVLGIITMRLVAGFFLILLEKFKGLAEGAYLLVGWIGIALVESGVAHAMHPRHPIGPGDWQNQAPGWLRTLPEIPEWIFWSVMVLIVIGSLIYTPKHAPPEPPPDEPESADVVASATPEPRGPDAQ